MKRGKFFPIFETAATLTFHAGGKVMFQGLRTVIYYTDNIARAKEWYTEALGIPPYYDEPFYVGFNVGGYELGLDEGQAGPIGITAYWGVDDATASYHRLLELGATPHNPVRDVGGDILLGTVIDPFGNILGIIENPHFRL